MTDARTCWPGGPATGDVYLYPGDGAGWVGAGTLVMSGLTRPGKLFAAGDISGDGHDDLMGIDKTTGELLLYRGNGAGGLSSTPLVAGTGWGGFTAVFGAGDVNGDGYQDLVARTAAGALMLYTGNGHRPLPGRRVARHRLRAATPS